MKVEHFLDEFGGRSRACRRGEMANGIWEQSRGGVRSACALLVWTVWPAPYAGLSATTGDGIGKDGGLYPLLRTLGGERRGRVGERRNRVGTGSGGSVRIRRIRTDEIGSSF